MKDRVQKFAWLEISKMRDCASENVYANTHARVHDVCCVCVYRWVCVCDRERESKVKRERSKVRSNE